MKLIAIYLARWLFRSLASHSSVTLTDVLLGSLQFLQAYDLLVNSVSLQRRLQ